MRPFHCVKEIYSCFDFNPRTPRGVRRTRFFPVTLFRYFNPRTPRGVRLRRRGGSPLYAAISIHAPREGCDQIQAHPDPPTAPISIHAPREGCDLVTAYTAALAVYFNPRTPRGVRQGGSQCLRLGIVFQSTHPARGATGMSVPVWILWVFQSTHPARGATWSQRARIHNEREIKDTLPARGA